MRTFRVRSHLRKARLVINKPFLVSSDFRQLTPFGLMCAELMVWQAEPTWSEDQCIVGSNCLVTHDYKRPVSIQGYDPIGSTTDSLRTVSAALAYDSPVTGETLILVVHYAIHLPYLPHNLFSLMQLRLNNVKVNDTPKFLTDQLLMTMRLLQLAAIPKMNC